MGEDTAELRAYLEAKFADLGDRIADTYVRQDVYVRDQRYTEAQQAAVRGDVEGVKGNLRWIVRAIVTSLALPLLVAVVAALMLSGKA